MLYIPTSRYFDIFIQTVLIIVVTFVAHAPGASRLEHPLQTFMEFGSDKAISLHVCSLYTVARLDSGALYWW